MSRKTALIANHLLPHPTTGCRSIVESDFPYCAMHIKCAWSSCGEARHFSARTNEYLAYCTNHATCSARRCAAIKMEGSLFCEKHTCHERDCDKPTDSGLYCEDHRCHDSSCQYPRPWTASGQDMCHAHVDRLALFCITHGCSKPKCHQEAIAERLCLDHFKEHYIAQGKRQVHAARNRTGRLPPHKAHEETTSDESDDAHHQRDPAHPSNSSSDDEGPHSPTRHVQHATPPSVPNQNQDGPRQEAAGHAERASAQAEYAGRPKRDADGSSGDGASAGGPGNRNLSIKIPQFAQTSQQAEGTGSGAAVGPAQGRRMVEVEDVEDSEGWAG
ncbi:0b7fac7a-e532-4526-af4e-ab3daa248e5b [Thermothielavioides terrestris]|uniref:0b7fac7a-e532-4526-af4e-ab3daa248e5b n=1 Tax=Thermothielavioides terrestris TaxID=2587410 RepID=A0A3S4ALB9_9PEZI|nr:0b7fac7a-e532-4526-af4e-ab3daa248e5b [Thermothielavioides terrestris]